MSSLVVARQQIFIISGPTACGKSELGETLIAQFGEQIGVFDADQLTQVGTETYNALAKFDDDSVEYTKQWICIARAELVKFVTSNSDKRALLLIGFLDDYSILDSSYADFVSGFSSERYYLARPMPELLRRFFRRVEEIANKNVTVLNALNSGAIPRMNDSQYALYEAELYGKHAAYGFFRVSESLFVERLEELMYKFDIGKKLIYSQKEKKNNRVVRAVLSFDGKENAEALVEYVEEQKSVYIPPAHARKIWTLAYRLNSDGYFGRKHLPRYADSVLYDGFYGCGPEIQSLVKLIAVFIQ